ncbi:EamA family transporter [Salinibacterium hongtaonis]|uniref:EamA family transporter n=1 Tax=Homoserinimonas hongtaonis TaxID=2079791 RepID=A0A2U1T0J1_9MICO|nr:EamA family transporter [Salinibacterium hongtaonis]PWB97404.1 EamA family transporter [Salinibacterium hongtaonis]
MNLRDCLLAALVATLWGINFVVIDWGMDGIPPLLFAAIRFTVVLLPAIFFVRKPDAPWRFIIGVGVFMSLGQFGFLYVALHLGMPPGLAALVLQAQVIFTMVIASGVLREIPAPAQLIGAVIGSVGLAIVAVGREGSVPLVALMLSLLAALSWAVGNVVSRASGISGGLSLTVWSALVVPLPLFALSLLIDGPVQIGAALAGFSWEAAVSTIYTAGLCTLFGYAIFNRLLSKYPSAAVVPWILLAPVAGIAAAWALLGEVPNTAEWIGGLLLLAGLLVAQRAGRRRRTAQSASANRPAFDRSDASRSALPRAGGGTAGQR